MDGHTILARIIGDNCVAEAISEADVRDQAAFWNCQEMIETGRLAFSNEDIAAAVRALKNIN